MSTDGQAFTKTTKLKLIETTKLNFIETTKVFLKKTNHKSTYFLLPTHTSSLGFRAMKILLQLPVEEFICNVCFVYQTNMVHSCCDSQSGPERRKTYL